MKPLSTTEKELFAEFVVSDLKSPLCRWLELQAEEEKLNFHRNSVDPENPLKIALKKSETEGIQRFAKAVIARIDEMRKARLGSSSPQDPE